MPFPPLDYRSYGPSLPGLHLRTQIIGKLRLRHTPWINHSWHVTLYVTPRGLSTGSVPDGRGGLFEIGLDLIDHAVDIHTSGGRSGGFELGPGPIADFYSELQQWLQLVGIDAYIDTRPNELPDDTPFDEDTAARPYDREAVASLHQALVGIQGVFTQFRSKFIGKCSPVQFFWGSFDLAVSRFSGRPAPKFTGAVTHIPRDVMREAYSHEVCSAGFWPGNAESPEAQFYSYIYPAPVGFSDSGVQPAEAHWHEQLGEFVLPYAAVASAGDPHGVLMDFLESTYAAAAKTADWDRSALEADFSYLEA